MRDHFAWQMLRERLALGPCLGFFSRGDALGSGFELGMCCLVVFKLQFHLLELDDDLLAPGTEDHMPELVDHELEMFDPLAAGAQLISLIGERLSMGIELGFQPANLRISICDEGIELLLLCHEEGKQVFAIEVVQIGKRSAIHGQSMPSIKSEIIRKSRMNKGESSSSSDCDFRLPGPLNSPPIDTF